MTLKQQIAEIIAKEHFRGNVLKFDLNASDKILSLIIKEIEGKKESPENMTEGTDHQQIDFINGFNQALDLIIKEFEK